MTAMGNEFDRTDAPNTAEVETAELDQDDLEQVNGGIGAHFDHVVQDRDYPPGSMHTM
jgi:hypothetical protein